MLLKIEIENVENVMFLLECPEKSFRGHYYFGRLNFTKIYMKLRDTSFYEIISYTNI